MTVTDFKKRVTQVDDEDAEAVDALCLHWIEDLCSDYGTDGEIARELIRLVRRLVQ